jgi:threonine/homoserine/homoserine lactone efflux protein
MLELLPAIFPILLVDVLNPVLFAMMVIAAGSKRAIINSSALLLGHTAAYFVAGIAVAHGIDQLAERLANPQRIDFILSGIIGIVLLWLVIPTKRDGAPTADEPEWELTPARCFGFGAVVNFIGLPFALPYFAVVDQILKANLSAAESLIVLGAYNLAYALPFLVVPVAVGIAGERAKPVLEKINGFLGRASDIVMPWMLGLLGLALVADSVTYFYRGEGLWQF